MKFLYVICTWISYLYCCNISFNFAVGPQRNHCKFFSNFSRLIFFQSFIYRTVNMDHRNWGRRKNWIGILEWSCLNLFGRRHARWSVRTRPFICNILLKTRLTVVFNCLCNLYYLYCMKDSKLRLALRYCSNLTFHYCSNCAKNWHTWSECGEDGL